MTHDEMRSRHFERLNAYRDSAEYATYAAQFGSAAPQGEPSSLLGRRWEIDEAIFMEALEALPPLKWDGRSFYMSEFTFGEITAKYSREGDGYYCEFARYPERSRQVGGRGL